MRVLNCEIDIDDVLTEFIKAMLAMAGRDGGPPPIEIAALLRKVANRTEQ